MSRPRRKQYARASITFPRCRQAAPRLVIHGFIELARARTGTGTFGQFIWAIDRGVPLDQARPVAVNTLVMFEIFHLFSSRFIVNRSLSWQGLVGNRYVPAAALATLALQALFTYARPLQLLFDTRGIAARDWVGLTLTAASVLFLVEIEKAILRHASKAPHPAHRFADSR
ncbi:cation transporting ATPase C-terminal domain-containing protein [Salinisphaera sp.]|uniref:cation transporting ATPase C-terminal domain-containing protein n=1 Tax=Salinisphaera sp. TaxID=1914330 RepID=UPI003C7EAB40